VVKLAGLPLSLLKSFSRAQISELVSKLNHHYLIGFWYLCSSGMSDWLELQELFPSDDRAGDVAGR